MYVQCKGDIIERAFKCQPHVLRKNIYITFQREKLQHQKSQCWIQLDFRVNNYGCCIGSAFYSIELMRPVDDLINGFFQLWVAYAPCGAQHKDAVQVTLEQIDLIKRFIEAYPKQLQLIKTSQGKNVTNPHSCLCTEHLTWLVKTKGRWKQENIFKVVQ